jgi:hypothetical protein
MRVSMESSLAKDSLNKSFFFNLVDPYPIPAPYALTKFKLNISKHFFIIIETLYILII